MKNRSSLDYGHNGGEGRIFFVVGNSRSGTHMMSRILGSDSAVFVFRELHFFEYTWNPTIPSPILSAEQATRLIARLLTIQRDGYFTQSNPEQYIQEARGAIGELEAKKLTPFLIFESFLSYETQRHGKVIPCDHTPRNLFYLREILDFYPNAYVVNMVRDPRDVLLSQKKRWRRHSLGADNIPRREMMRAWANYHPITISMLWNSAIQAGDAFADHQRVLQVKFEELVGSPTKTVQEICTFIGLEFQENMLQIPQVGSSHKSDAPDNSGINPNSAGRWRRGGLDKAEFYICQKVTGKNMKRHNYEARSVRPFLPALIYYGITWIFKSGLALLLNIEKNRSIFASLRRRLGR